MGDDRQLEHSCITQEVNDHLLREICGIIDNEEMYLSRRHPSWIRGGTVQDAPVSQLLSTLPFFLAPHRAKSARDDFIGADFTM